jgi:hypothetical protein
MVEPKEPSGADGDIGESETGSPRDHDTDKPLDVVPGVGLRVDTPSGAGAGRVGGIRTPAGQPAGHDASHESSSVRDARTRRPRWLASKVGLRPTQAPTTQDTTASRTSLDSEAAHGKGAPTPVPVDRPMTPLS